MIEIKKENEKKGKIIMKKITTLTTFIFLYVLCFSINAETKRDCSQYSTKTMMGIIDKKRCEAGKEPRKKWNIGKYFTKRKNFAQRSPGVL